MRSFTLIDFVSLFAALRWTVALVVLALAFGAPLALAFATGRISRFAGLRWTMAACIQIVQSVPLLGLLFFFYFGMPMFLGIQVPALPFQGHAQVAQGHRGSGLQTQGLPGLCLRLLEAALAHQQGRQVDVAQPLTAHLRVTDLDGRPAGR